MGDFGNGIITVLVAIVGVATLAVVFSKNANTAQVSQSFFGGIATDISAAVSPITGGSGVGTGSLGSSFIPNV
jgi:hypothetical protein